MERQQDKTTLVIGNATLMEKFVLLLLFCLLLAGVYLVLRPFIVGIAFGAILAIAAWPVRSWLVKKGFSGLWAAGLMLLALLAFVLIPMVLMAPGLAVGVTEIVEKGMTWIEKVPPLPDWIAALPLVGGKLDTMWQGFINQTPESKAMIASYAEPARQFLTSAALGLVASVLDISVALIVATSFWSRGEAMALVLRDSLTRLGGPHLGELTDLAASTTRGVFYGIVGTSVVQGLLMAVGLLIVGVPGAAPLGFLTLIFALSQFGTALINVVWAGAAWWLYAQSGAGFAFWFIIAWGIMVTFSDNVLKPIFIGPRLNLPIMLVILGVFGGFLSFGFLGLFIGPTLLAVAYDLLDAWRHRKLPD